MVVFWNNERKEINSIDDHIIHDQFFQQEVDLYRNKLKGKTLRLKILFLKKIELLLEDKS